MVVDGNGEARRTFRLEIKFQAQLHLPWRVNLLRNLPKASRVDGSVQTTELRVVKGVEAFSPEFQVRTLAQLGGGYFLENREGSGVGAGRSNVGKFPRSRSYRVGRRQDGILRVGKVLTVASDPVRRITPVHAQRRKQVRRLATVSRQGRPT